MKAVKEAKKHPRLKRFWLFYGVLVAALLICSALFINHVKDSLRLYEAAQPEHFADGIVSSLRSMSAEELAGKLTFPEVEYSRFDDFEAYKLKFASQLISSELTFKGESEVGGKAEYGLYSDGVKAADIIIQAVGQQIRLGLMSIPEWELAGITAAAPQVYEYDITYPSAFRVTVNGQELSEAEYTGENPIDGFEYEAEYVKMPVMLSYHIKNLLSIPDIRAYNNLGEEIPVEAVENSVLVKPDFASSEFPGDLKKQVDVLKIAETWSRFLTRDLSGPRNGLEEARAHFIPGSYFWNMAYDYATGIDITFVSGHRLDSFTDEAVTDYIRYNDDCFSCIVSFKKNMTLTRSGSARTDVFNSRLFFVLYDGTDDGIDNPGWYITDMQAVTDGMD